MLFAAGHVKNDIVSVLNEYQAAHADPNFKIEFAGPLDIDHKMLMAARARIEEAEAAAQTNVPREETLLMVVGRGTSDPDANGNVSKIGRMISEGMGFAWGEVCYSGVTYPLVAPGLEHAAKLGYRRIIVFPYFLFTGILVERIYSIVDEIAGRTPEIEFIKAQYLSDQISVIDTFEERVRGILSGENNMNCQLCKYREQIICFEAHHGLAQEGHHHHVEGVGTEDDAKDGSGGEEGHTHSHHPAHPHPEHPHGPGKRNPSAVD